MGTTLVSQTDLLFAPVVAWVLCAPKYLAGTMTLGELMQASAAFVVVQLAFN
jgi:putative ATP-binding cassette transporter